MSSSHHVCPHFWPSGATTRARAHCVEAARLLANVPFAEIPVEDYGHYIDGRIAVADTSFPPLSSRRVQVGMSPESWVRHAILKNTDKDQLIAQICELRKLKDDVFIQIHDAIELDSVLQAEFSLWSDKYDDFFDEAIGDVSYYTARFARMY